MTQDDQNIGKPVTLITWGPGNIGKRSILITWEPGNTGKRSMLISWELGNTEILTLGYFYKKDARRKMTKIGPKNGPRSLI